MPRGPWIAGVALVVAGGCASMGGGAPHAAARSTRGARIRLGVVPVESELFPEVTKALNAALREVRVSGLDEFQAQVGLDVVLLSIECPEHTATCYRQVGAALTANRLLFAEVTSPQKGGHEPHVTITLFDVDGGRALHAVERTYKSAADAVAGIPSQMSEVVNAAAARADAADRDPRRGKG